VVKRTSPDSGETQYAYDASGNQISKTDANQVKATYQYDALNRLTAIRYPDPADDIDFTYDEGRFGNGRRTGMSDAAGSTRHIYNAKGQRVEKSVELFGISYALRANVTAAGRLAGLQYPSGREVDYLRGADGRITGVRTRWDGADTSLAESLSHHPFGGGLSGMQTGAGSRVANQSGACGRLTIANPGEEMEQQ
jgi:YD repeat-containing protein